MKRGSATSVINVAFFVKRATMQEPHFKMLIKHSDVQPMSHVKKTVLSSLEKQPQGNQSNKAQFQSQWFY